MFTLAHSLEIQLIMGEKAWLPELKAAGHIVSTVWHIEESHWGVERGVNSGTQLLDPQPMHWCCSQGEWVFTPPLAQSRSILTSQEVCFCCDPSSWHLSFPTTDVKQRVWVTNSGEKAVAPGNSEPLAMIWAGETTGAAGLYVLGCGSTFNNVNED